jgi:serine phosphatase RsbU (regulator of sigma subunit)
VLLTDGVLEARAGGDQYGLGRLDAVLTEGWELPAQELADAVLDDCRAHAGGELSDDCAVLVVRRA